MIDLKEDPLLESKHSCIKVCYKRNEELELFEVGLLIEFARHQRMFFFFSHFDLLSNKVDIDFTMTIKMTLQRTLK